MEQALSAYDFLAKLDWIGVIGFIIAATLVCGYFIASIAEKLFEEKKTQRKIVATTLLMVIFCISILTYDANRHAILLDKANDVKQWMLEYENDRSGYIELSRNVPFPDNMPEKNRIKELKELVKSFPDEFSESKSCASEHPNDNLGIILINSKTLETLNKQNDDLIPYYKAKLLYNMKQWNNGTLSYQFIRNKIDIRYSNRVLDKLISKYPLLFISVYEYYNVDDSSTYKKGKINAIRISPDSEKTYLDSVPDKKFNANNTPKVKK